MQFPSRFFPSFHNGENKRSVATSSRPIFCPPKWWFYDCSARYYYSSPGTTFSYRILRLKKKKNKKYVRIIQCCVTAVRNWLNTKYLINIDQDGLPHLWLGSTNTIKIQKSMHFEFVPTTAFFFFCSKLANWILVRFEKSIKGPKRVYFHFSYFLSGSTFWSSKMGWANSRDFNSFFQPTIWAMSNESPSWNDREDRTGCRVD